MIYLRPSRRITPPGEGDPLLAGMDILDEYMRGLQRARTPFTLVIESEHGSDLDKEGVRDTVLHLRIYGHDGSDLTDLLPADFAPEWYQGETQVGVGMSLALTWQDVKTYSQTYSVTLTAWRIYEALATQESVDPGVQHLFSEIQCRGEFVLQGSIRFISDRLGVAESGLNHANEELRKKLDTSHFEAFKAGDFKSARDRIATAEGTIQSHTTALKKKLEATAFEAFKATDFKSAKEIIQSHTTALQKKLDASAFDSFKAGEFQRASDRLTSAEGSIKSHTTALQKKLEASTFDSFKKQIGSLPTDKTLTEHIDELPTTPKVYDMLRNQARSTYTVRVFTTGQIRDGKMDVTNPTDPTTQQPAVLHWAMASNQLSGQAAEDFYDSLKWTVNKGRTTAPLERTITGSRCYVLAKDIVTPTDGSAPYYDIQLERIT